ncbi:MAG: hypothetical protein GXP35_10430 [Actinobacteria bacterium]|nr:hypothetical protein [Actinomycetota bacterium]
MRSNDFEAWVHDLPKLQALLGYGEDRRSDDDDGVEPEQASTAEVHEVSNPLT